MNAPASSDWTAYLLGPDVTEPAGVVEIPATRPPDRLYRAAGEGDVYLPGTLGLNGMEGVAAYALRILLPPRVAVYDYDHLATARLAAGVPEDLPRHGPVRIDPPDPERRATVDRRLLRATPERPVQIDVGDEARALADVLDLPRRPRPLPDAEVYFDGTRITDSVASIDLPPGRERRARERAVLAEDEAKARKILAERDPDPAALEAERVGPWPVSAERDPDPDKLAREARRPVPTRPGHCAHGKVTEWCDVCCPAPPARLPGAPEFDADLP